MQTGVDIKMKIQTNRPTGILLALLLVLSPLNAVFSVEIDHCDPQTMHMPESHKATNHQHDKQQNTAHDLCFKCISDTCCCDNGNCSCVIAHIVYLPGPHTPLLNSYHLSSYLPVLYEHPSHPLIHPPLRPPIS